MKSGKIAAALILILVSSQGCLFDPRDSEPPETGEVDTWIVPNTPKDVFLNLASGWVSAKNSNYERSLDPEFRFYPRPEDEALFGNPQLFADWTKEVEIAWLTRVKEEYPGARTIQFGDADGVFAYEVVEVGRATYEGQYLMTVDPGDGNVETYAGIARFIVVQGTLGWVLTEWRDLDVNGSFPTSGYLRGVLRAL